MNRALFWNAIGKFALGVLLVGLLIFVPAGTLAYHQGWLLMGILFIPMFLAGIVMMGKNPELLRKRLNARETQKDQSLVIRLSGLMFLAGFALAGLSYRFSWLLLPGWTSNWAAVVFLGAYLMYGEVLRENAYLSRTIQVQQGQKVIDTGLYGIVRHPMYSATVLLFLSIPLVLGSVLSFGVFLCYPMLIVFRIKGEETLLEAELPGYAAYQKRVKYRLLPFVW